MKSFTINLTGYWFCFWLATVGICGIHGFKIVEAFFIWPYYLGVHFR